MAAAIRILYVDDERDLLDIGKLFLEESGNFTVTTALSAAEGIRLLEQEKFDVIVSDYQMPGMDGIQFLVEVRTRFGPIPFILFTGKGREEIVIQAINSGADFYLQKGGEPGAQFAELSHKIKQAASRKRADDALRKSEEKYRHLIEHSNEAILVAQDGMLKLVNHRFTELLGYPEQELRSIQFPMLIYPDDRAMVMERHQKRLKGEELPSRYPFRLNPKNGNTLWVEISAVCIDWEGRPATLNFLTDITERKKADDLLQEEQQFSKLLLDSLPGIFYVYTYPENRIVRWNRQHETLLGYTAEELKGKLVTDLHLSEYKDAVLKAIDEVMEKGQSSIESTLLAKDGRLIPFYLTGVRFEASGRLYFMGIGIDITERKRAEHKMISAQERLKEAHRLAHIGTWDWIMETDTVTWSDELCKIAGWDPSLPAPTYTEFSHIYTPSSWEYLSSAVTRALTTGETYNLELEMMRPDGSIRWTNAFGSVIHDEKGKVTGLHGTVQDITERKLDEEALRKSEEKYRNLFMTGADGIVVHDAQGKNIDVNAQACEMLGYSHDELLAMRVSELIPPEEIQQKPPRLTDVLTGKPVCYERKLRRKDGTLLDMEIRASRVTEGTVQAFWRDITERKQAEAEIKKKNQELYAAYEQLTASEEELRQNFDDLGRSERALLESEEKYRLIADNAEDWIYWITPEGKFRYISPSCERVTGYCVAEFGAFPHLINEIVHPEDRDKAVHHSLKIKEEDGPDYLEYRIITKKGEVCWISHSCCPVFSNDGQYAGRRGTNRDITERKRAEEALCESRAKLDAALASLTDAVFISDNEGRFLDFNDAFATFHRFKNKEECARTLAEYPDIIDVFMANGGPAPLDMWAVPRALRGETITNAEYTLRRKDTGETWWGSYSFGPIRDKDGKIIGSVVSGRDVTDRKRTEEELVFKHKELNRAYEQLTANEMVLQQNFAELAKNQSSLRETTDYLNNLLDYANAPIIVWDSSQHITRFNHAFEQLTGRSSDEVLGQSLEILFPSQSRETSLELIKKTISGERWETVDIPILHVNGSIRTVLWNSATLLAEDKTTVVATIAQGQDITERKLAEDTLVRVNQKLNVITNLTRRDLTNQIFVLKSYLEMTKKNAAGQDRVLEGIQKCEKAILSINEITEFTKDFQDMGAKPPRWQNVKIVFLLGLSHVPMAHIRNDIETGTLEIFADPLMEKICQRIFENSLVHGDHVTQVRIWYTQIPDALTIFFEDDGIGIPQERKEKIFSRDDVSHGPIRSLIFVREILDITGINIRETGEPGKGARFEMTVPKGAWRFVHT